MIYRLKKVFQKKTDIEKRVESLLKKYIDDEMEVLLHETPATLEQIENFEYKTGFTLSESFKSFVCGNLYQHFWLNLDKEFYRKYEFIMQIETNFYTIVHIFRNKENKEDFKSIMGRS